MTLSESFGDFYRVLVIFFVYSAATVGLEPVVASLSLRMGVALAGTLLVVVLMDAVPMLVRGERPTFGAGSYFSSARGFLAIVTFFLVAAVLADGLRATLAVPEAFVTVLAALVAAVVVFGGLVAYYSQTAPRSERAN